MKLPKKVNILGHIYTVIFNTDRQRQEDDVASCNFRSQVICIDGDLCDEAKEAAFIHEIIEAVNYHNEYGFAHQIITGLETAIYQVIKDNKLHF